MWRVAPPSLNSKKEPRLSLKILRRQKKPSKERIWWRGVQGRRESSPPLLLPLYQLQVHFKLAAFWPWKVMGCCDWLSRRGRRKACGSSSSSPPGSCGVALCSAHILHSFISLLLFIKRLGIHYLLIRNVLLFWTFTDLQTKSRWS